jgi:hypothetical protein
VIDAYAAGLGGINGGTRSAVQSNRIHQKLDAVKQT